MAYVAWLGIGGLTLTVVALAMAGAAGILDVGASQRLIGLALGLMMILAGNMLPKLRPSRWMGVNTRERSSGWLLALAGIAWVILFALAPLSQAKQIAALIGVAAVLVIGVYWAVAAASAWLRHDGEAAVSGRPATKWQLVGWLLFAVFYLVVIACVKYLVEQRQLANELSTWILAALWLAYAVLSATFGRRDDHQS